MQDLYAAVWDKSGGPAWVARHRMTAAEYQAAFDQFANAGYRLLSVSGYGVGGQAFYAALWDKSAGPALEARHGLTAAQYQTTFNALQETGHRLRLVNGYTVGNQDFYAAIWDKTGGPPWQARHRMTADQYQQTFDQLQHQGYRLSWVSTYAVQGADLYAAVWEQTGGGAWEAHHRMSEAAFQANNIALAARGLALRCVDACSTGGSDLYTALWQAPASPGAVAHHGMTAATYQQFFDQSAGQGLRPTVIAGYTGSDVIDAVLTFTMQKQQQPNWCWAATSVSISHYYNANSTWTQCAMANAQIGRTDCCGAGAGGPCNIYGFLDEALTTCDHLDHVTGSTTPFTGVRTEVAAGRPLGIRVAWSGGGAHFIAATGVEEGDLVFVSDCGSGSRSVVAYNTLVTAYNGSGSWTSSFFTKA